LEDRCLPSFLGPVNYATGPYPQAVVAADFNNDGVLDLAVVNYSSSNVSILLGNADGTFQGALNFTTGTAPLSVAVGDFNADGKLDIVTANAYDISILLGNGNGTFQAPTNIGIGIGIGSNPTSVAVGDFNGDGKLDLGVTANTTLSYYGSIYSNGYANVLLGNGDGTFQAAQSFAAGSGYHTSAAVGDFNGDGKQDFAMANFDYGTVSVLLGDGRGALGAPTDFSAGDHPQSVATADVNGDGKLDLVTANLWGANVSVLLGNGNGTFQAPVTSAVGPNPTAVAVGDFNRDGKPDLAVINSSGVSVLLGNGNGTFQNPLTYATGGSPPLSVAVGDFNGDGFPDLAVANYGSNTVSVLLNDAKWEVAPAQASSFAVSGFPTSTTAGTAGAFTITAKNANGTTATNYTGTVRFTSSDGLAVLPADYTFTAADAGVHAFSAILKTAGTQSLTATDTTTASLTGSETGITVTPAAASTMTVAGFPSPTTAGVAGSFTVTLKDPYGNIASGYTGTVHFTSSDGKASLPANYTFRAADAGVHAFSAILKTAGTQSIAVADTTTASLTGTDGGITVKPGAASRFLIRAPSSVHAGVAFSLTITVQDAYGNVVTGYTGTIHFKSTDGTASLPANYTFTAADKGVHTFSGLVLRKKGTQKIILTDTLNSSLTGSVIETVL
jgi:hypothetical protein